MVQPERARDWVVVDGILQGKGVRQVPSPNCEERPAGSCINLLVIHNISLPPGEFGGDQVERFFTNCLDPDEHPYFSGIASTRVSAHLYIDRRGDVIQFVPFHLRAWHAGESCFDGVDNCNDFSVGIELEGTDSLDYEQVQYLVLAKICRLLLDSCADLSGDRIVGHSDIAPGRKTDPGPCFDWEKLFALIEQD